MLHPEDISPCRPFYPLRDEGPTSLVQDLPPAEHANCLLLECGDFRNILYTLFHDEDNGDWTTPRRFSGEVNTSGTRSFDITCCDAEPAIIGL